MAEFNFDDPPAENGDLVFDPFLFENQPVSANGSLSFVFWNKTPATSSLIFGDVDGKPKTVPVSVNVTLPALTKFIPPPAEFVGITVAATLPLPTLQAALVPRVDIAVDAVLPTLTLAAQKRPSAPLSVVAALPMPVMVAEAQYRTNTQRPTVGKTDAPHQVATKFQDGPTQPQQDAVHAPTGWEAFFQRVTGFPAGVEHRLPEVFKAMRQEKVGAFQDATGLHDLTMYSQQDATRTHQQRAGSFQEGTDIRGDTLFKHQDGTKTHGRRESRYQEALRFHVHGYSGGFQTASQLLKGLLTRHQDGVPPPPGISVILPPQPPVPVPCYTPSGDLVFEFPWLANTNLVFVCDGAAPQQPPPPGETIVVPVQRVYIVLNTASLRRVSDNALIPTYSMSLSLDAASWTWGFDASIPMEAQALVEPTSGPVELLASVNGVQFRLLAENLSRERVFGKATMKVSGRGRNAILDAPYAPTTTYQNTIDRTAQQLAADVLTYNGVPLPWSVQWGLTDWLVPAEVFTHQGTHISALNAIAQAAGGYLQPHRTDQTIRILPKYPVAPWNWSSVTPDFELPADVTVRESIQWTDKPQYNRVFVSGQQSGVLGQVTRQGTAGDVVAPMVTDPLITHADAARQRGIAILADTGRVVTMGLSLPVLAETGVIEPGKFVLYVDGGIERMGIVRGTSVSVNGGAGSVKQQITVESFA